MILRLNSHSNKGYNLSNKSYSSLSFRQEILPHQFTLTDIRHKTSRYKENLPWYSPQMLLSFAPGTHCREEKKLAFELHQIGSSTIHFGLSNGGTVGGGMPIRHSFHQLTSGLPNKMHSGNASADRECSQHSDVRKWRGYDNVELKTLQLGDGFIKGWSVESSAAARDFMKIYVFMKLLVIREQHGMVKAQ